MKLPNTLRYSLFLIPYSLFAAFLPSAAYAVDGVYDDVVGLDWILTLLQNVISIALQLIGVAAFIMLMIGSFKMVTSSGDPKAADSAKKTISWAIGGLFIAAIAWFIFKLIFDVTGVNILDVSIPTL